MKIKINNRDYKIKPVSEFTVKESVDFKTRHYKNSGSYNNLIQCLSVITGLSAGDIAKTSISEQDIRRITAYIGGDEEMPEVKEFYYKRAGKTLYRGSLDWQTLGARQMLESSELDSGVKQAVYLLAIYLSGYDDTKAEKIYNELQGYNAFDVFGFILFFFRKLQDG